MKAFFAKIWKSVKQWPGIVWEWIKSKAFDTGAGWAALSGFVACLAIFLFDSFWVGTGCVIAAYFFSLTGS